MAVEIKKLLTEATTRESRILDEIQKINWADICSLDLNTFRALQRIDEIYQRIGNPTHAEPLRVQNGKRQRVFSREQIHMVIRICNNFTTVLSYDFTNDGQKINPHAELAVYLSGLYRRPSGDYCRLLVDKSGKVFEKSDEVAPNRVEAGQGILLTHGQFIVDSVSPERLDRLRESVREAKRVEWPINIDIPKD
ncbi:MAG: hypothetical protein V1858_05490 [Candidatus Gottesmanbacteria bacterium]